MDDFSKPKIVYPNMTKYLPFFYDTERFFTNQKCFIITGECPAFLTAFLNSSLFKYCFRDNFPELLGGTRELSKVFFDKIPVIKVTPEVEEYFDVILQRIQKRYADDLFQQINDRIYDLYDLSSDERLIINFIDSQ